MFRADSNNGLPSICHARFPAAQTSRFLHWSANFDRQINSPGSAASYGLTAQQVAEYSQLHTTFAQAYRSAIDPSAGGPSAIMAKMTAEIALRNFARKLAAIVRAQRSVNDEQRIVLGLKPRRKRPSRIGRPERAPKISIEWPIGRSVTVHLRDAQRPTSTGKPRDVDNAVIFSFVGEYPPPSVKDWRMHAMATRTTKTIYFEPRYAPHPGVKVWITAQWSNPRGETGPTAPPVFTQIGFAGGVALPVAQSGAGHLALAA